MAKYKDLLKKILKKISELFRMIKSMINLLSPGKKRLIRKYLVSAAYTVVASALVISVIAGAYAEQLLNKINYGDIEAIADRDIELVKELDKSEEINFDIADYSQIDNSNNDSAKESNPKPAKKQTIKQIIETNELKPNESFSKDIQQQANNEIKENITSDGAWRSDDVFNLLIIGYDAGMTDGTSATANQFIRADAIIIMSVNQKNKTVKMVSISRATYVYIPNHGYKRINAAHAYGGANLLVETIELNYKVKIDKYISCDFEGFKAIVDILGGVTIDMSKIEADFAFDDETLPEGKYTMNGTQALRYVRLRKTDSDRTRTFRQRKILKEIMGQAEKMDITEKLAFMDAVLPYVTTNFNRSELVNKAFDLETYLSWNMKMYIIPPKALQLQMRDGYEVIIPDWDETTEYIHSLLYDGVEVQVITLSSYDL